MRSFFLSAGAAVALTAVFAFNTTHPPSAGDVVPTAASEATEFQKPVEPLLDAQGLARAGDGVQRAIEEHQRAVIEYAAAVEAARQEAARKEAARKEAARKEAARKEAAEQARRTAASTPPPAPAASTSAAQNREIGRQMASARGWGGQQFSCLDALIQKESQWRHDVWNRQGSGAYGIPQALPGNKMAAAGADWRTNPATQLRWMLDMYIPGRHGTPCGAWSHSKAHGWY